MSSGPWPSPSGWRSRRGRYAPSAPNRRRRRRRRPRQHLAAGDDAGVAGQGGGDEPAATEACEGCPILFKRVALVKVYRELEPEEVLSYRESKRVGVRYIFKVVAFNDRGLLGEDSNIVRLTTD